MKPVLGTTFVARVAAALLLCLAALPALVGGVGRAASTPAPLPRCKTLNAPKDLVKTHASDLAIVQQGYQCLLRHYITRKQLDDRTLLRGAFNAITQALSDETVGISLGPLTGDRGADWQTFATAYRAVAARFKPVPVVQQALSTLSLDGMTQSLHDDHTTYMPPDQMKDEIAQLNPNAPSPTLGIVTSPITTTTTSIYVTDVFPHTPAAAAGLQPGDTLTAVNGHPLFGGGQIDVNGIITLIFPTMGQTVTLGVTRPRTGATFTVTLTPRSLVTPATTARVVAGSIAYVKLYMFTDNAAAQVFSAIKRLGLGTSMRGLILDLRGNGGGAADQAVRIISALTHHAVVGYQVDGRGHRDPQRTDNDVSLLHTPVAVLIDGGSASSSELVAGAVRDLHLGTLVGTRSAGAIAGAEFYGLNDGSGLEITEDRVLGPLGETIDGIGITPRQQRVATAADLSAGHDPVIDQAVRDVRQAARASHA